MRHIQHAPKRLTLRKSNESTAAYQFAGQPQRNFKWHLQMIVPFCPGKHASGLTNRILQRMTRRFDNSLLLYYAGQSTHMIMGLIIH